MIKACLLFALLLTFDLACKQDTTAVDPSKIRLSKIEYLTQVSSRQTPQLTSDKLSRYLTFTYDDKGRLISEQVFDVGITSLTSVDLVQSYLLEYNSDNKISKITDTFKNIFTYTWNGKTVSVSKTGNGYSTNFSIYLNGTDLPTKRVIGTNSAETLYDKKENITELLQDGKVSTQYTEHDTTKLNPFASSYELRIFHSIASTEGFSGQSRNWLLKIKNTGSVSYSPQEPIIEFNKQGYPTVTKATGLYGGTSVNTTKYTYITY